MRYIVRKIHPWSAAKVGALFGVVLGLLTGMLVMGIGGAAASALAPLGQTISPPGWPAVFLLALFGGSAWAVLLAVCAVVYNLASWLGASLAFELEEDTPRESSPARDAPRGAFLQGPLLDAE